MEGTLEALTKLHMGKAAVMFVACHRALCKVKHFEDSCMFLGAENIPSIV